MSTAPFRAFVIRQQSGGAVTSGVESCERSMLAQDGVLIRVTHSSLNFKDALASTNQAGIAKKFPHVPGIDAAGTVESSSDSRFQPGDAVFTTGHEMGVERWGGWAELACVPGDWLFKLPPGLTLADVMTLGTAGFTAAQCVQALQQHGVQAGGKPVVVTGATGGVGCLSVILLAQLGYEVIAVSGKADKFDWLKSLGAAHVAGRDLLTDIPERPLLSARYAGAVDTVGGQPLATLSKLVEHRGTIACCGLTAGIQLPLTLYPFLLRGLTLCGIDSAWCPDDERVQIWNKLSNEWRLSKLDRVRREVPLAEMGAEVTRILNGQNVGRVVVTS